MSEIPEIFRLGDDACPRCGGPMRAVQVMNKLSRADNKTYICSDCGTDEAIESLTGELIPVSEWPVIPI